MAELLPSVDALLLDFTTLVHGGIRDAIKRDGLHKSFEGRIFYSRGIPGVFDEGIQVAHNLRLDCYVLGPARSYEWEGTEAVHMFARATADVKRWIKDDEDAHAADVSEAPIADDGSVRRGRVPRLSRLKLAKGEL